MTTPLTPIFSSLTAMIAPSSSVVASAHALPLPFFLLPSQGRLQSFLTWNNAMISVTLSLLSSNTVLVLKDPLVCVILNHLASWDVFQHHPLGLPCFTPSPFPEHTVHSPLSFLGLRLFLSCVVPSPPSPPGKSPLSVKVPLACYPMESSPWVVNSTKVSMGGTHHSSSCTSGALGCELNFSIYFKLKQLTRIQPAT